MKSLKELQQEYAGLIEAFVSVRRLQEELRCQANKALAEYRTEARKQGIVVTKGFEE